MPVGFQMKYFALKNSLEVKGECEDTAALLSLDE